MVFESEANKDKDVLTKRLEDLLNLERDKDVFLEIIDTKIHLNWEIEKEETF